MVFAIGDLVRIRNWGEFMEGKESKVREMAVHPYGEGYGMVYLIEGVGRDRRDVWVGEGNLELVKPAKEVG